ncbi:DUF4265 domain-containing protein [Streptomyces sp. NPDC057249]|uniref:DUF4265 domain-containing protein n=1 Tax=Streptomyces sp. NPDC057249 TaxID=3346067 RepID=UPI00362ABDE2
MAVERVWATPLSAELVRIDNIPWFVPNLALGDLVSTRENSGSGDVEPVERIRWSGNCTIRVIPYASGALRGDLARVVALFEPLGVAAEVVGQFRMVGLNVPPAVDIAAVKRLLAQGGKEGWWDYEESCVGDAWENEVIR